MYFHDVPAEVRDEALGQGEPQQSWTPMTQPWPLDAWPDVPIRVLVGRDDRLFPAAFQRRVAVSDWASRLTRSSAAISWP